MLIDENIIKSVMGAMGLAIDARGIERGSLIIGSYNTLRDALKAAQKTSEEGGEHGEQPEIPEP